jgi:hypothetical protein
MNPRFINHSFLFCRGLSAAKVGSASLLVLQVLSDLSEPDTGEEPAGFFDKERVILPGTGEIRRVHQPEAVQEPHQWHPDAHYPVAA